MDNFTKQNEEIAALSAIYGDDFQVEDEKNKSYSIKVADTDDKSSFVKLYVKLTDSYPSTSPPTFELSAPHLNKTQKNHLSNLLEDVYLSHIGQTVLFQWVEKLREEWRSIPEDNKPRKDVKDCSKASKNKQVRRGKVVITNKTCPTIVHGEVIKDRKSSFQGHAAVVESIEDVRHVLEKLKENRKIEQANHNMYAYRIYKEELKTYVQDCDDDGEAQAGGRLLHLLQIVDVKNTMVVVSRWFGGILLGGDRFRHINNAARQALVAAGLISDNKSVKK